LREAEEDEEEEEEVEREVSIGGEASARNPDHDGKIRHDLP
jgi:hypothetical protein